MKTQSLHRFASRGRWIALGAAVIALGACTGEIGAGNSDTGSGSGSGSSGTGSSSTTGGQGTSGTGATGTSSSTTGNATGTSTTGTGSSTTGGGVDPGTGQWKPAACNMGATAFASGRIWQITDSQYVNMVRDVLGITLTGTDTAISGAVNTTGEFTNLEDSAGSFTDMVAQNYQTAAQKVSTQAQTAANMTKLFGGATPTNAQITTFITSKVARLWRRNVTSAEQAALLKIYTDATANAQDGGPTHGVDLLVQAALQSPSFLFRTELGANATPATQSFQLNPFELAAAVSFLFTDSAPDDALWATAVNSTITDPTVLAAQIDRIMALPAAQSQMAKYVSYWLWVERVPAREKDTTLFPKYTPTLQQAVYQSGFMFIQDVVATGKLTDLFASSKVYVNKEMSTYYGIPGGTGTTLQGVTSTLPERSSGILTQPALLVATNKRPGLLDPIHHGLFVLEGLLDGGDIGAIPPPPANALAIAATMHGNERELADQRAMTAPCNSCHTNFDPYGLTRYTYDSTGAFSATKYVSADTTVTPAKYSIVTSPTPLDTSAKVPDIVGPDLKGPLADVAALAKQLNSDGIRRRVAYAAGKNLTIYAMGHDANIENSCALQNIKESFYSTGSFTGFFKGLVTSPGFVTRNPGK